MEDKKVELVFRNVNNEDVSIVFDIACDVDIKCIKERLCDVLLQRERKCSEGDTGSDGVKRMKLFFKGRPLRDNELLMDLHVSNKDVMLYMITAPAFVSSSMGIHDERICSSERQCVNSSNNNNNDSSMFDTSSIIESVNHVNNNNENTNTNTMLTINRGFNRFVLYGVSPNEIAMIRLFFHSSMYQRSIQHNITLDWSREGILEREEMWLRSQSNNIRLNNNHHHPHRNNNNTTIRLTRRYNRYDETNVAFMKGFLLGFILNIFGIIFMILVRNLSIKFKCGFQLGILTSISCCIIPYLLHSM